MQFAIETDGLTKRFGERVAVDQVSLHVPAGSAFGLLGPNGAGKTTVLRCLLGLTRADAGTAQLGGLPVPAQRRRALADVGALIEEPRFHGHLTGRESLRTVAAVRDGACDIKGALARVGLTDRADERVSRYSLGMRQRLALARCLMADPALLILDEPVNGLDPAGIQDFRALVRALVDEGRTVVLSSHLLGEIERTCDHVAIIDRGRVLAQGAIAEIAGEGAREVVIACSQPARAATLVAGLPAIRHAACAGAEVRLRVDGDLDDAAAQAVRALVGAGMDIHRVASSAPTLEERFMQITTRLEEAA